MFVLCGDESINQGWFIKWQQQSLSGAGWYPVFSKQTVGEASCHGNAERTRQGFKSRIICTRWMREVCRWIAIILVGIHWVHRRFVRVRKRVVHRWWQCDGSVGWDHRCMRISRRLMSNSRQLATTTARVDKVLQSSDMWMRLEKFNKLGSLGNEMTIRYKPAVGSVPRPLHHYPELYSEMVPLMRRC